MPLGEPVASENAYFQCWPTQPRMSLRSTHCILRMHHFRLVNRSENASEVSLLHLENAYSPMLINPSEKATDVSPLHLLNALFPMLVNPSGKVTETSFMHYRIRTFRCCSALLERSQSQPFAILNASAPMLVSLLEESPVSPVTIECFASDAGQPF